MSGEEMTYSETPRCAALIQFQEFCDGLSEDELAALNAALAETYAPGDKDANAEVVRVLREGANDVLGGNCAFADDDAKLLCELARLAIAGGLTTGLHGTVFDRFLLNRKDST